MEDASEKAGSTPGHTNRSKSSQKERGHEAVIQVLLQLLLFENSTPESRHVTAPIN